MIAYFCLFLFTKSDQGALSANKLKCNQVYRVCAFIILTCLVFIGIYSFLPITITNQIDTYNPIFWLESIAIIAFGFAWLVKGEAIMKDQSSNSN